VISHSHVKIPTSRKGREEWGTLDELPANLSQNPPRSSPKTREGWGTRVQSPTFMRLWPAWSPYGRGNHEWRRRFPGVGLECEVPDVVKMHSARLMADHPMHTRLKTSGAGWSTEMWFEARQPEELFAPLAHSTAALFASVDRSRVRKCVLHFHDTSKKGTRRWCSRQLCGNRLKVAAYAARQRVAQAGRNVPPGALATNGGLAVERVLILARSLFDFLNGRTASSAPFHGNPCETGVGNLLGNLLCAVAYSTAAICAVY